MLVYIGREYDRGLSMVERGVALNPNLAVAWSMLGWVSVICGQPERAIESFEKMIRVSPSRSVEDGRVVRNLLGTLVPGSIRGRAG